MHRVRQSVHDAPVMMAHGVAVCQVLPNHSYAMRVHATTGNRSSDHHRSCRHHSVSDCYHHDWYRLYAVASTETKAAITVAVVMVRTHGHHWVYHVPLVIVTSVVVAVTLVWVDHCDANMHHAVAYPRRYLVSLVSLHHLYLCHCHHRSTNDVDPYPLVASPKNHASAPSAYLDCG